MCHIVLHPCYARSRGVSEDPIVSSLDIIESLMTLTSLYGDFFHPIDKPFGLNLQISLPKFCCLIKRLIYRICMKFVLLVYQLEMLQLFVLLSLSGRDLLNLISIANWYQIRMAMVEIITRPWN